MIGYVKNFSVLKKLKKFKFLENINIITDL